MPVSIHQSLAHTLLFPSRLARGPELVGCRADRPPLRDARSSSSLKNFGSMSLMATTVISLTQKMSSDTALAELLLLSGQNSRFR